MSQLLHQLVRVAASREPDARALSTSRGHLSYAELDHALDGCASALAGLGVGKSARVAIWLEKRFETVIALFAASRAGAIFVPVNPVLKAAQVCHILRDSGAKCLITGSDRYKQLAPELAMCPALKVIVIVGTKPDLGHDVPGRVVLGWEELLAAEKAATARHIDTDITAILYTSGSTGRPKGVVLTHRNMVAGAHSVAQYLENTPGDHLLALLPLSFDAGFSQLSTAFHVGASVHLFNYLLPADVPKVIARQKITGLAAVPPVWIPLSHLNWPQAAGERLRYITNTGGAMPRPTLELLRQKLPNTKVFLMYGLTEAFRSTYLPPHELDRRPDSMGRAIPNAEIMVVRPDGAQCDPDEPGELVHRGALVAQGYWNDPVKTRERFRPAPGQLEELVITDLAVWSGDTVRRDIEGFLYFVGRRDEMIKTSGYRVSPTEIEEALYEHPSVGETAAFGAPHSTLGHCIVAFVSPAPGKSLDQPQLSRFCLEKLPRYMVPSHFVLRDELPRNPNGKLDRSALKHQLDELGNLDEP